MLKVNEYGGRQAKVNEKRQCFKGWETLVKNVINQSFSQLEKGHKKANKENSVKSFVYKGYATLRARVGWKKKSMIKR